MNFIIIFNIRKTHLWTRGHAWTRFFKSFLTKDKNIGDSLKKRVQACPRVQVGKECIAEVIN